MMGVFGMCRGTQADIGAGDHVFAGSYALVRFCLVLKYLRVAATIGDKAARSIALRLACGFAVSVVLWVVSCFFSGGLELALCLAGSLVDLATPFIHMHKMLPVHHSHMPERFACFTVLTTSVMLLDFFDAALESKDPPIVVGVRSIAGLLIPFSVLLLYTYEKPLVGAGVGAGETGRSAVKATTTTAASEFQQLVQDGGGTQESVGGGRDSAGDERKADSRGIYEGDKGDEGDEEPTENMPGINTEEGGDVRTLNVQNDGETPASSLPSSSARLPPPGLFLQRRLLTYTKLYWHLPFTCFLTLTAIGMNSLTKEGAEARHCVYNATFNATNRSSTSTNEYPGRAGWIGHTLTLPSVFFAGTLGVTFFCLAVHHVLVSLHHEEPRLPRKRVAFRVLTAVILWCLAVAWSVPGNDGAYEGSVDQNDTQGQTALVVAACLCVLNVAADLIHWTHPFN